MQCTAEPSTKSSENMKEMTSHLQSLQHNQTNTVYNYPEKQGNNPERQEKGGVGNMSVKDYAFHKSEVLNSVRCFSLATRVISWRGFTKRPVREVEEACWPSSNTALAGVREREGLCWARALTHVVFLLDLLDNLCVRWSPENPFCCESCKVKADGEGRSVTWESLGMLVLTVINPCCGAFRQLSTSSSYRTAILLAFSSRQRIQAAFPTLIQATGWATERKTSPNHETVRSLQS